MAVRPTKVAGTVITRPFLVVIDVELPNEKPRRNKGTTHKDFHAARTSAIRVRELFDSLFGEYGDYFVIRVVDLRDYTVCFEYN